MSDTPILEECSEQVEEYFVLAGRLLQAFNVTFLFLLLFTRNLFCGEFLEKQLVRLRHRRRNWLPLT
jgi:hypothetical protein